MNKEFHPSFIDLKLNLKIQKFILDNSKLLRLCLLYYQWILGCTLIATCIRNSCNMFEMGVCHFLRSCHNFVILVFNCSRHISLQAMVIQIDMWSGNPPFQVEYRMQETHAERRFRKNILKSMRRRKANQNQNNNSST